MTHDSEADTNNGEGKPIVSVLSGTDWPDVQGVLGHAVKSSEYSSDGVAVELRLTNPVVCCENVTITLIKR
jgi:hypothetical protein